MKRKFVSLVDILKTFLTIGTIGFGGGLAIIALIQDVCVEKKKWLDADEFSHAVALGQFLGPFAVNVTIFVGYRIRGFKGAIVSLVSFLAPSVTFVILLSALYMHFQKIPSLQSALIGIGPVVVALILSAAINMGKGRINNLESIFLVIAAMFLVLVLKVQVFIIILLTLLYGFIKVRLLREKLNENI